MDTSAATGGGGDAHFIQQQGGHTHIGGSHALSVTRDFFVQGTTEFTVDPSFSGQTYELVWSISDLSVAADSAFRIYQTYKLNSVSMQFYYQGQSFRGGQPLTLDISDFFLYVAPYSRDPFISESTTDAEIQFLPGVEIKFFKSQLNQQTITEFVVGVDQPQNPQGHKH